MCLDIIGNPINPLSNSERKVYNLLICGLSINVIANMLSVAPSTISTHRNHIFSKMYVSNTKELMYKRILELEKMVFEMKTGQL